MTDTTALTDASNFPADKGGNRFSECAISALKKRGLTADIGVLAEGYGSAKITNTFLGV